MKVLRIYAMLLCCTLILSCNVLAIEDANSYWLLYARSDGGTLQSIKSSGTYTGAFYTVGFRAEIPYYKNSTYVITADINYNTITPSKETFFTTTTYAADYSNDSWSNVTNGKGNLYENITAVLNFKDNNTATYILTFHIDDTYSFNTAIFKYYWYLDTIANFNFNYVDMNVYYTNDPDLTEHQEIVNKLNQIIDNQNSNNQNINNAFNDIINNQIIQNNNWNTIINYGNNYNQIEQNIINGLGTAEDQLSNAEDAIQNKSQSLVNKVTSQWTTNKGVASSFLTTITPAASAIGTVTDDFFEAIPEEIKNAVITIMLIVFIGWLIGRVEG